MTSTAPLSSITQIRPADFDAWRQRADASPTGHVRVRLLDVREPWEVQLASVVVDDFDLTAIPMGSIPDRLDELDVEATWICLCHHGVRSQRVAEFLLRQGFAKVSNLAGGIDAWSLERDPSVPRY